MRQVGECKTGLMENTIFLELAVQEKQIDMNLRYFTWICLRSSYAAV
jgi:hypothetical protein